MCPPGGSSYAPAWRAGVCDNSSMNLIGTRLAGPGALALAFALAFTFGAGAARAEGAHYEIKKSEPKVAPGGKGQASVTIATKDGWHVNAEAPITIALEPPAGVTLPKPKQARADLAQSTSD